MNRLGFIFIYAHAAFGANRKARMGILCTLGGVSHFFTFSPFHLFTFYLFTFLSFHLFTFSLFIFSPFHLFIFSPFYLFTFSLFIFSPYHPFTFSLFIFLSFHLFTFSPFPPFLFHHSVVKTPLFRAKSCTFVGIGRQCGSIRAHIRPSSAQQYR